MPDPSNPEQEMLWDGEKWTGLTRPRREPGLVESGAPGDLVTVDGPAPEESPARPRRRVLIGAIAGAVVLIIAGTIVGVTVVHSQQASAQQAAERRHTAAVAARDRAELAKEQQDADDAERATRVETVTEVEGSVKTLAEKNATDGVIDGPILDVSCNPVSGSTDDLTDTTTTFNCFVSNKDNGDGTSSGYYYNSTVNWTSGEYTFGLGRSGS